MIGWHGEIIHACFQCNCQGLCLFKGQETDILLQFGIVPLIDAGKPSDILLHMAKRKSSLF